MRHFNSLRIIVIVFLILFACAPEMVRKRPVYDYSKMDKATRKVHKKVEAFLEQCIESGQPVPLSPAVRIDSLYLDKNNKYLAIFFSKHFSYPAYRIKNVAAVYRTLKDILGRSYKKYQIAIYTLDYPLEQLIPNYYRPSPEHYDWTRMPVQFSRPRQPFIANQSRVWQPTQGLGNRFIDVRPSHGWYYNNEKERWEWQRPRLFQTVEDLLPFSFVVPYLVPMLENSGATVFLPRERDFQINEIVIDNDRPLSYFEESFDPRYQWSTGPGLGFAQGSPPYPVNHNLFLQGTYRVILCDIQKSAQVSWVPEIPETGYYAVYISYGASASNVNDARYTVHHAGGQTRFKVNQRVGGGTWIYLGKFKFLSGKNSETGRVTLTNESADAGRYVSADAVRFGGGMGDIMRNGRVSGRPRFVEASKYYLQYAGFPDTLIYNHNENQNDYKDDYMSRSEYANYIYGAPFGPEGNRETPGLGIPIDLSMAFHTDAGITYDDTTIGTLSIYSLEDSDSQYVFPDGMSRLANRDLADIMQTQIVEDLRKQYDPAWIRRYLMDARYSEAVRPNMPAVLLELLSHQNFLDMKFALDPRFRFDVARAMYKSILRFIKFQNQESFVIQPLPVTHFQATLSGPAEVTLKWRPQTDTLEHDALPDGYIVYTRRNDGGFDNGQMTHTTQTVIRNLQPGIIYSYKVTAMNQGGESFPSEILSVCWLDNQKLPVLIINGFDRICGPRWIETDSLSGFANFLDEGVPDKYTFNFTGAQIDFEPTSPFRTNDAPGHGASLANYECQIIAGNTFDFPYIHGKSIRAAGYPFVSVSDESIMDLDLDIARYRIVDLILGEEKETPWPKSVTDSLHGRRYTAFPEKLKNELTRFLHGGGSLFASGAYIGTDLCRKKSPEHPDVKFAQEILKFSWTANHASKRGRLIGVDSLFNTDFQFNTKPGENIYCVEAPDAIDPVPGAQTVLRYEENRFSAATAFKGDYRIILFGFPFETILAQEARDYIMKAVIHYMTL